MTSSGIPETHFVAYWLVCWMYKYLSAGVLYWDLNQMSVDLNFIELSYKLLDQNT